MLKRKTTPEDGEYLLLRPYKFPFAPLWENMKIILFDKGSIFPKPHGQLQRKVQNRDSLPSGYSYAFTFSIASSVQRIQTSELMTTFRTRSPLRISACSDILNTQRLRLRPVMNMSLMSDSCSFGTFARELFQSIDNCGKVKA